MKETRNSLLDPTYGAEGIAYPHEFITQIEGTLRTADGLIGIGSRYKDGDMSDYVLFRLNSTTGALDKTFGTNGLSTGVIDNQSYSKGEDIVLLEDGRFLMLGSVIDDAWQFHWYLTRFDANGNLDTEFGTQGHTKIVIPIKRTKAEHRRNATARLANTSIASYRNGTYVSYESRGLAGVIKYDADGLLDSSFANNGFLELSNSPFGFTVPLSLHADSDGLLIGISAHPNGLEAPSREGVARVSHNGEYDRAFGERGFAFIDEAQRTHYLTVLSDKRIILPIWAGSEQKLFALDKGGKPDASFNSSNLKYSQFGDCHIAHINATDEIVVIGSRTSATHIETYIGKFLSNGDIDSRFAEGGWGLVSTDINRVGSLNVQPDGNTTINGQTMQFPLRGFSLRLLTQ